MPLRPAQQSGSRLDAAAGDFEREALSFVDSLYASALRLTANPADAEDLVQDTYLKTFRAAAQFEPGSNLKAWMHTILHNTFLNARRQASRTATTADSEAVEQAAESVTGPAWSPEELLLRNSLDPQIKSALHAMPAAFRQAVWLRDVEDFTYAEIATMLQVPVGTVMSRISRGRRWLHEALRSEAPEGRRPGRRPAELGSREPVGASE